MNEIEKNCLKNGHKIRMGFGGQCKCGKWNLNNVDNGINGKDYNINKHWLKINKEIQETEDNKTKEEKNSDNIITEIHKNFDIEDLTKRKIKCGN